MRSSTGGEIVAQNLQEDIKATIKSVAMLPTKHPITGPVIKAASMARGMSKKSVGPPKKGVHASQQKKRSMTATEERQHRMMRSRAGR
jgi:hypothetical protein